ncbi:hypothetical protein [Polluticoccus soli]|uniref:hypothetical protein n=1 Tax=Polluticoccus soli TaxID=3034150 RepID=UPI0023E182E0|nr:hypothetical protein [Flavipsychrobacter sp. JY13-12]
MKKIVILAASLFTFVAAKAQVNSSASQTVNLNLSNAIEITFTGSGTATGDPTTMAFTTVAHYADGVESGEQQLKVRSNKNFKVAVKSNATNFTYTGSTTPAPTMVVADVLNVMVSANNTGGTIANSFSGYQDVPTSNIDMLSNCSKGGNQTFSVKYKAEPGFDFPAGNYAVDVVYTATQL